MIIKLFRFLFTGCWHNWSKWETTDIGVIRNSITKAVLGKYIDQRRICSKCGMIHLRTGQTM